MHVHCLIKKHQQSIANSHQSRCKKKQLFLENSLRLVIANTCFINVILN